MKKIMTIDDLVVTARLTAQTGIFDGTELTLDYFNKCRYNYRPMDACIIFTRDAGHHTCGWWKNPDYERCFHLSISFLDGYTSKRGLILSKAFFADDVKLTWIEPPYSQHGRACGVWHYRLFCDDSWNSMKPSGEVYSRKMPSGWMSFSEKHKNKGSA